MKAKATVLHLTCFFILVFSASAGAETFFVRPAGGNYGSENGTSYANAWDGFSSVVWGEAGVKAGDTLLLCLDTGDPPFFTRTLAVGASGKQGAPILIKSEDPQTPVTLKPEKYTNAGVSAEGREHVSIHNLNIKDCGFAVRLKQCSKFTIERVTCLNNFEGIFLEGGSENTIVNCRSDNMVDAGIALLGTKDSPLSHCVVSNNVCSNSKKGDGITLHRSNDENHYNIGQGNKVLYNTCFGNGEEGLDITSGTGTLVEGNVTYDNQRSAVIWHGAVDITFVRNQSRNEAGLLVGPEIGRALIAYNVFDSGDKKSALTITRGSGYSIFNNVFRSSGAESDLPPVVIGYDANDIDFRNNIVIASDSRAYVLRMGKATPKSNNVRFDHNCWWHPLGSGTAAFKDTESTYSLEQFRTYDEFKDTLFADPLLNDDFSPKPTSPCIGSGAPISSGTYVSKDLMGNTTPVGVRDIGAIEVQTGPMDNNNKISAPEDFRLLHPK
jgi:parallel beta-helix repeat protein